jgi:hypothetical protein
LGRDWEGVREGMERGAGRVERGAFIFEGVSFDEGEGLVGVGVEAGALLFGGGREVFREAVVLVEARRFSQSRKLLESPN